MRKLEIMHLRCIRKPDVGVCTNMFKFLGFKGIHYNWNKCLVIILFVSQA